MQLAGWLSEFRVWHQQRVLKSLEKRGKKKVEPNTWVPQPQSHSCLHSSNLLRINAYPYGCLIGDIALQASAHFLPCAC